MIIRSVIVAVLLVACVGCKTGGGNESSEGAELQAANGSSSSSKRKAGEIGGWGFDGFKFAKPQNPGVFCTQEVKPEQEACFEAKGKSIAIETCKFLCSVPILDKSKSWGKVVGFSFEKLTTADAPSAEFCPQVVRPEEEACRAVDGRVIAAKGCKVLCSKPIAASGKVAGYNFEGAVLNKAELPGDMACPQILRPEEDACRAVRGKLYMTDGCKPLCSEIINPLSRDE